MLCGFNLNEFRKNEKWRYLNELLVFDVPQVGQVTQGKWQGLGGDFGVSDAQSAELLGSCVTCLLIVDQVDQTAVCYGPSAHVQVPNVWAVGTYHPQHLVNDTETLRWTIMSAQLHGDELNFFF